jgi:peptidoglycan/LPS O-acetylase OafA/YrhL
VSKIFIQHWIRYLFPFIDLWFISHPWSLHIWWQMKLHTTLSAAVTSQQQHSCVRLTQGSMVAD